MAEAVLIWTTRLLALAVVVATALPLVRKDAWWIRGFEFPRVQLLGLALAVLPVALLVPSGAAERWLTGVAVAAAALLQATRIMPFTPLWPRRDSILADDRDDSVGLLVFNVLMTNRSADSLLRLVERLRPDLVLLVETDRWWLEAIAPLERKLPHRLTLPLDNTYGMLLLSRHPLGDGEVRFLVEDDVPSIRARVRVPGRGELTLYGLHPRPPAPEEATTTTKRDAELLLVAKEVRDEGGSTIVAGDLNDVAWSYTTRLFRRTSGLLDPRIGRGLYATFPAERWWLRFPLDHVFHSADLRLVDLRVGPPLGSDHLPLFVKLRLESREERAEPPEPDTEELRQANEKIVEGIEDARAGGESASDRDPQPSMDHERGAPRADGSKSESW